MSRLKNISAGFLSGLLLAISHPGHAETAYWSDNFETNAGSRWTTNSVWHIGSPTAGPATNTAGFRAYSASNCASTQNYPANQDVRLICTNYIGGSNFLVVPATNQFPRLRFWHWFNLQNALGFVEISTNNGGSWNQISSAYQNNNSGGVWSRPSIDLSAYAGQSVQFAFHFYGGTPGNGQGWYVDDVAVVTDSPVFYDPESFEAGEGDWSVSAGTWEIGQPTTGPSTNAAGLRAHSGTNCAATVLAGNYATGVDSRLVTPPFDVPANSPTLRFWHWYNFNSAIGFVEITTDGSTWNQISPTYQNNIPGGNWINVSLDLSAYAGKVIEVAFRFAAFSSGTAAGWYVDDVSLVAAPVLIVPTNWLSVAAGTTLTVTNGAMLTPNGPPAFALISGPTNSETLNPTNGVLAWNTSASQPAGYYTNVITVTDPNGLSATNRFVVVVLTAPKLALFPTNGTPALANGFQFSFQTLSNTSWRIDASTNLVNWLPIFTNTADTNGLLPFTDPLATNLPLRFYRAVFLNQ